MPPRCVVFALGLSALLGAGCKGPGAFVWADSYAEATQSAQEQPYALCTGDVIQVRVFNQEQLATRARVRADGKVSLPLVNDVTAAGLTPAALAQDLEARLREFIKAPSVTVSLEETRAPTIYVAGEVARPGVYPLESAGGVLQALVSAGGLASTATSDRIFVLRETPAPVRVRFTYDSLTRLTGRAASFRLRAGDVVVVE